MALIKTEEQLFDVRLVERHIQKGMTSEKDFNSYLGKLPDLEENSEYISKELIFDEETDADLDVDEQEDEE